MPSAQSLSLWLLGKGPISLLWMAAAVAVPWQTRAAESPAGPVSPALYEVRHTSWSRADESDFRAFIAAIGASDCNTLDSCLHSRANPFFGTDPPGMVFESDCSDLPYVLRFYFAWKRGLPFSYESEMRARGPARDLRYSMEGNEVAARFDVPSGVMTFAAALARMREAVSSANYRVHPDLEGPLFSDFYSPAIAPAAIRAGTIVYDPAGHVGIVYRVDTRGRIHFFDAHTDFSLTEMTYDLRFARMAPALGAGFKNWRPIRLVGARRRADGVYVGGHIEAAANDAISDFSDEQYFGNGKRPSDRNWKQGGFALNGESLDYYDYVRGRMAGGKLVFEPVEEIGDMVRSICTDLHYRAQAVALALSRGIQNRPEPDRLPYNIYGAEGDWETYSTPSRDARLKTAFKALRDAAQRFVEMEARRDPHLSYEGSDIVRDLMSTYDRETGRCSISYTGSDGSRRMLSYEDIRQRLFAMSFDPYQCAERRWGATSPAELATCRDGPSKRAWYAAEQRLRNQIDRPYDARMDFTLAELARPGPGKGVDRAPDTDVRGFLLSRLQDGGQPAPESAP